MDDPNLEDKSTAIPSFSGESENQAPLQQQQPNFHPSDDASLSGQILRNDLVAANQPSVGTTLDNNFPEGFPTPIGMKEPVTGKARDDGRSSVALELSEETTTARLLPDLLGEERQSDIRDDLNAKLRKINTLIANAAEIQRKYETVADPASEKSMREMQDKLQAQKQSLERELLMVTRLQQMEGERNAGTSAPRLSDEEKMHRSSSERTITPRAAAESDEGLSHSVGLLRGSLKDVMERKSELEGMVDVLQRRLAMCETKEDQINLTELLRRHSERIVQLNHTVHEAQETLSTMENLNRQKSDLMALREQKSRISAVVDKNDGDEDDEESPADAESMRRLRDRLTLMRSQVESREEPAEDTDAPTSQLQQEPPLRPVEQQQRNPTLSVEELFDQPAFKTFQSLICNLIESRQSSENPSTERRAGPALPQWDGQNWNNSSHPQQFMSGHYADVAPDGRPPGWPAVGLFPQNPQTNRDRFDSNQSSDSEVEDFERSRPNDLNDQRRANNFAQFGKRNDLGLPQTPKKDLNSRNWKNGAESGRGRSAQLIGEPGFQDCAGAERDQHPEDIAQDAGSCHAEMSSRDMPLADMVKSLQKIMAEQQKILNTCAQYVAKPPAGERGARSCTPDQIRGGGDRNNREIPMINNSLRNGEQGHSARGNSGGPSCERQGLLNNQRNDARSFSMSPSMPDNHTAEIRQRVWNRDPQGMSHQFEAQQAALEAQRACLNSRAADEDRGRERQSVTDLMDTVLDEYRGDLPILGLMLSALLMAKTHASRRHLSDALMMWACPMGVQYSNRRRDTSGPRDVDEEERRAWISPRSPRSPRSNRYPPPPPQPLVKRPLMAFPDLVGSGRDQRSSRDPSNMLRPSPMNGAPMSGHHQSARDYPPASVPFGQHRQDDHLTSAGYSEHHHSRNFGPRSVEVHAAPSARIESPSGFSSSQLEQLCRRMLSMPASGPSAGRANEQSPTLGVFHRRPQQHVFAEPRMEGNQPSRQYETTPFGRGQPTQATVHVRQMSNSTQSLLEHRTNGARDGSGAPARGAAGQGEERSVTHSDSNGSTGTADYDMANDYPRGGFEDSFSARHDS